MVSRKNIKYKIQQDAKRVPHYGIRKLSIGVASVLLGTVFYMQNGSVHADVNPTLSTGNDSVNVVNKDSGTSGSAGTSSTSTGVDLTNSGVGSVDSASSVVSTDDATNLTVSSQVSGSPVEGETNQSNNAFFAASEPEGATPASQVNVGTDNSNSISSLPPASHHQPSTAGGNQSNERLFDNLSLSVNQKLNVNNSSLLASKAALTGISNQRFAGLQQSLVQQDTNNTDWTRNGYYQARASNVDFQLTQTYNNSADFPDETRVGFTGNVHFGVKTHFSLNTSDLKYGNRIYLGSMVLSNSLDDNSHNIPIAGVNWSNMGFVSYEGQRIGTVYCRQLDNAIVDWFISVTNNNNYVTPVITVSDWSDSDISAYNWDSSPLIYKGVPDNFDECISMPGGKRYTFHMFNDISEAQGYNIRSLSVVGTHQFNWYDWSSPTLITNGGNSSENWTKEMLDSLNNINGKGVVLPNTGYRQAYSYHPSNNQILPSTVNVVFNILPKDANNRLTYECVEPWGAGLSYERLSDGLSLVEIEQQCPEGHAVYSVQNDGSVLCYVYFAPSSLVMSESYITDYLKQHSKVIAIGGDKALQNTLDLYFGNALQGRTMQNGFSTAFNNSWSNYESVSVSDIKALDPDTGQVLAQCGNWHNVPDTLQFSDKGAIRVHYINGYNGQQIGNSQTFNDDQGKTLSYQAQNSLGAGYSLRRSGSYALLNGQSLPSSYTLLDGSQKSSITYPRENTVSDVYYVIDPDTETVKVNVVDTDTSSILSSYTLSGLYASTIQPTNDLSTRLESLLSSGKYDLVTNPLTDSPKYSTTNSPITISLKHHIDSTQRHYRVIEDLPDGTKKVIIDMEAVLYKDADADSYYWNGAVLNGKLDDKDWNGSLVDKKLLKQNEYQDITGTRVWASDPSWLQAKVDSFAGYKRVLESDSQWHGGVSCSWSKDQQFVLLDMFNGYIYPIADPLASRDFHITYSRCSYPVTVNYYDIDGKLVDSVTSMHKFGDTVSIAPVAPANYVLASGQAKVDYLTELGLNEVDFLVESKLTTTAETKMVSRTIRVQTPDGQTNNVVQMVTFVRNSYLNQVTKQTTYSTWSFGGQYQFNGYLPKSMAGYTADVVPAVIVTPDSLDTTANVVYHKIPVVYEIDYKLANGTLVTKAQGVATGDGTIHLTAPQGYRLLTTVTDVQVDHSSQKLTVLVLPDEQTYTAYSALPSSVTEPLTKTVTRTVKITLPNGHVRTVKQSVKFERTATVAANGKITYSDWTGVGQTSFDRLFVPKRRGYRLVMTNNQDQTLIGVNQMVVDPTMNNVVINVKYVK